MRALGKSEADALRLRYVRRLDKVIKSQVCIYITDLGDGYSWGHHSSSRGRTTSRPFPCSHSPTALFRWEMQKDTMLMIYCN